MEITELDSLYDDLDKMTTRQLLTNINQEDQKVASRVSESISQIGDFVDAALKKMKSGGRLFYIGAGTSGRLGVLDASECPPTFGVDHEQVVGIIAGGDRALRIAKEGAEDDMNLAWQELESYKVSNKDVVLGIASSGKTPYVLGGLQACKRKGILTGALVCNPQSPIAVVADLSIEVILGPEFITGSTRMKAGTAQKMILNMISTSIMIQLGKVKGNRMVDMKLSNAKLKERAQRILMEELNISIKDAADLLAKYKSVRLAIEQANNGQITEAT